MPVCGEHQEECWVIKIFPSSAGREGSRVGESGKGWNWADPAQEGGGWKSLPPNPALPPELWSPTWTSSDLQIQGDPLRPAEFYMG